MGKFNSTVALCALLALPLPSIAVISDSFTAFANTTYDFVIVGANAGAVLANRLTENPRWKVLLIEAGPSHEDVFDTKVPAFVGRLQGTPYDWNYTTVPQTGLNDRVIKFPRGHILGGCSSIDGVFYTRGSSSDYDRWAKVTGDSGWSWKRLLPYFLKHERWINPANNHDTTGEYDPRFHSTRGLTYVTAPNSPQAIDPKVIQASRELGGEFKYNIDINSGDELGIGWNHATVGHGERSSAATSYLAPKYVARENLHILVGHRVTRVLKTSSQGGLPSLRTVQFTPQRTSTGSLANPLYEVTARKEVLLSAGVVGTTQILLLSGVGNATELKQLEIQQTVDLPDVGKNMSEQPIFFLTWTLGINDTVVPTEEMQTQWLAEWKANRTGPLTGIGVNTLGWLRIPDNSSVWENHKDPSSGKNTPHIELGWEGGGLYPLPGSAIRGVIIPLQPESLGTIWLRSSDPFDDPFIDFGFLNSELDLLTIKEGVNALKRFFAAPAWEDYRLSIQSDFPENDEAALDEYIRNATDHAAHPVGTASMSAKGAKNGVVDPDLKLKKAAGLRVVDASVMPYIPAGHTQAAVYAIAERAADLIKASWERL
ncbi:hypothetical protein H1R20_g9787, partial [Candolleomyces eurysporus]